MAATTPSFPLPKPQSPPIPEAGETYPMPTGEAAEALVWAHWPALTDNHFKELIASQQRCADLCTEHRDGTLHDIETQSSMLVGQAGDANRELLIKIATHADEGRVHFNSKVTAAQQYWDITNGVKIDLTRIAHDAQKDWDKAKKTPGGVGVVMATYAPEVASIISGALTDIAEVSAPTPLPEPPTGNGAEVQAVDNKTTKKGDQTDEKGKPTDPNAAQDTTGTHATKPDSPADAHGSATDSAGPATDPNNPAKGTGDDKAHNAQPIDAPTPAAVPPGMQPSQGSMSPGRQVPSMPSMPASPLGGGSGGGGSSGLGGLGSGGNSLSSAFKPPATPSVPAASAGTSPASAMPKLPPPPESFMSGLSNAGSSFQSGVASGMGASGAVTPPSQFAQPLGPMPTHQPVVASPSGFAGPTGGPVGAGPITVPDGSAAAGGHAAPVGGTGGAPMAGGGGVMPPPPAAGGQPLAPYSPPAGAGGGGAGPAGTMPASSSAGSQPSSSSGGGAAGSPAVVAGNSSASGTAAVAASASDINPDIAIARRVLAGLVRGSQPVGDVVQSPVSWAVAVLRTPTGLQTVVASSMGGGAYVPVTVYLPVTARLAVVDSALPIGWAADWMGSQQPTAILAEHFERLSEVVAGVKVSAIVTSEIWPKRPDCGGDFVAVRQTDILQSSEQAPVLDAGHQHRLAATDLALMSRLAGLGRSFTPDIAQRATSELAVRMTEAVLRAASEPDETGQRLCGPRDETLWKAIRSGSVSQADWSAWVGGLDTGLQVPEIHAPRDQGPSAESVSARMWYRHYYRAGRVAELLACWDSRRPSSGVWDVAYCAVAAGFGQAVASAIADVEQQLRARQS